MITRVLSPFSRLRMKLRPVSQILIVFAVVLLANISLTEPSDWHAHNTLYDVPVPTANGVYCHLYDSSAKRCTHKEEGNTFESTTFPRILASLRSASSSLSADRTHLVLRGGNAQSSPNKGQEESGDTIGKRLRSSSAQSKEGSSPKRSKEVALS